ncbi:acyl-CoA dehydrogenase family protein [Thalassovita taeanensis]|uniref:Acyl-CoA dehydrogenase n=1 Tax=Thalassovita taeanensis TaxID=657014 RepID=A0A1H9ED02_9RHOB|nr:acyl-CoA dehydrogenase family protein [Thalassovita taeanensis]SEQ23590.1 acyl-CoA dehydrogenase [Thalassovita taeanensis]
MLNLDSEYLAEEHRLFREQLRKYIASEIAPEASAWEEAGIIPPHVYERMGELGFLGLGVPAEYGGAELDALGTVVFGEELGRSGFGGLAASISDHADMALPVIVRSGTPEQKSRFIPDIAAGKRVMGFAVTEPGGGSDLTNLKSTAVRDGDDWILNGQKTFITNAISADVFITIARTDPNGKGAKGYSIFVVEKGGKGFSVGAKFEKTGWCSSDMSELFFDDFRVPAANLIGEEGRGFYGLMRGLERERLALCSQCIGMMERSIEITLEHVKTRPAYGKTLWDLQSIRHEIASHVSEISAAKLLIYHAAAKKSRGFDVRMETSMMKATVPQTMKRVVDSCVQMHGASGYMRGTEIERIWRDTRPFSLGGGAASVMLDEVAKLL